MDENAFFVGNSLDHLNLSESRLHILLNEAPFAAAIFTGNDFIIEMANKIVLSVWGKTESVIGKPLLEALPEISNQPLFQRLKEVYSTGNTYQGHEDNLYIEMGGMLRNVVLNFTYKPVYDDERNITSVLAFGVNVTEHVEGRKRIEESEERTRLAVDVAGIGTFDINHVTGAFIPSQRLNEIYGFDTPRPHTDYVAAIHPDDQIIRKTAYRSAMRTGELSYEARIIRPDNSIRWIRFKGKIFFDSERIPIRMLGTVLDVTEQNLAIKRLEESEQRFRTLITETPEVASGLYIGKELRIQYVNDVMIRFWGKDISVIGKNIHEALPELEGQAFFIQLEKVFATGETFTGREVKTWRMLNGKLQAGYFNYTFKALRNSAGEIYGIHHMAVDVTEQVLSKQKYIKSERKFRHLLMQSPFGICILKGNDFVVEFANDTFLKLVGRRQEEYAGKPVWIGMPELESRIYNRLMREVMRTGTAFHGKEYEVTIMRNGRLETIFVDFTYDSLLDENGKPEGIIVLAVDVTDKVSGRMEIEKSRDRFYSILESLPQIAWTANVSGKIDYITQQWYDYTGQPEGAGLGKRWIEAFLPEERDTLLQKFYHSVTTKTLFEEESKIRRHDGEYRWHLIRGVPICDDHGKVILWVGTSTDIHDQKLFSEELERKISERTKELERSNSELEQFAYVSSHDLQEPLRKISIFTDMLRKNAREFPEGTEQYLDKISSASFRMANLIKDVLEFSRLSKSEKQFQPVDLNEALRNVLVDFELTIEQKNARIEICNLGTIEAIPLQIHQLFHNLLSNSLKFSSPDRDPYICVQMKSLTAEEIATLHEIDRSKCHVCIEWQDNGIGFSQEYANQIFVIFQRLNNRKSYAGTGIGLAICKKIVSNHRGEIFVTSEIDKGTRFCIILPEHQQ